MAPIVGVNLPDAGGWTAALAARHDRVATAGVDAKVVDQETF